MTMDDLWHQHVSLEISDAYLDDERLLDITKALLEMEAAYLIPEEIAHDIFNQIKYVNLGGNQ